MQYTVRAALLHYQESTSRIHSYSYRSNIIKTVAALPEGILLFTMGVFATQFIANFFRLRCALSLHGVHIVMRRSFVRTESKRIL